MNTIMKRFAAVLVVASALSGAVNAKFELEKFKQRKTELVNPTALIDQMKQDLRQLNFNTVVLDDVKAIVTAIEDMIVNNKVVVNKVQANQALMAFGIILKGAVKRTDIKKVDPLMEAVMAKLVSKPNIAKRAWAATSGYIAEKLKRKKKADNKQVDEKKAAAEKAQQEAKKAADIKTATEAVDAAVVAFVEKAIADKKADEATFNTAMDKIEALKALDAKNAEAVSKKFAATCNALKLLGQALANQKEVEAIAAKITAKDFGYNVYSRYYSENTAKKALEKVKKAIATAKEAAAKAEAFTAGDKNTTTIITAAFPVIA